MDAINLVAQNNTTFQLTMNISQWPALSTLATSGYVIVATFKFGVGNIVALAFSSVAGSTNLITYNIIAGTLTFTAPQSSVQRLSGIYNFDVKAIGANGYSNDIFGGTAAFNIGVSP